jgi:hypothetical protein
LDDSFQARYDQLRYNRIHHGYRDNGHADIPGVTLHLDGNLVRDIPDLFLQLGEQVNGPGGYFGACLDGLDDCLFGKFGLTLPITLQVTHWDALWQALSGDAIAQWYEAGRLQVVEEYGEDDEYNVKRLIVTLPSDESYCATSR